MTADRAPGQALAVVLPYPPTMNHLYANVGGRRVKTKEGREYGESVQGRVFAHTASRGCYDRFWRDSGLAVALWLYPPDRRKRDVDNVLKGTLDSVCRALQVDDSTIQELHVYKCAPDKRNPRLELLVTPAKANHP